MNPQILLFRQKNKHVFIRITAYAGNRIATHYVANGLGIVDQFHNTDDLKYVINKTIDDIKELKKLNQSEPEKLKALDWIIQQLYDSLQPTLF